MSLLSVLGQTSGNGKNFSGNSPYSRIGIGDINPQGSLRNIGMGGVGVASTEPEFINSLNPALLINYRVGRYDSLYTILEGSVQSQFRKLSTSSNSENNGGVNFNSFAYLFPITKKWSANVGIKQFSTVNYRLSQRTEVSGKPGDTASILYNGQGGIYQVDLGQGFKISRNFDFGFQLSYLFGNIRDESFSQLENVPDPIVVGFDKKTFYSGFLLRPGMVYRRPLNKKDHPDSTITLSLGFSSDFFLNMTGKEKLLVQRKNTTNIIVNQFTLETVNHGLVLPNTYRAGVGLNKFVNWNIAADFSYTNWSSYRNNGPDDSLKNSFTIALGGEFLLRAKKENEFLKALKRKYLRFGIAYSKTPIYINGRQLDDFSISIGHSFAIGRKSLFGYPLPKLNVALVVGQRGTQKSGLIKDQYFKAYLGVTINDKWFKKRRVD